MLVKLLVGQHNLHTQFLEIIQIQINACKYQGPKLIWGCIVHFLNENADLCLHQTKFGNKIVGYVGRSTCRITCKVLRNHTNTNEDRQVQVIWGRLVRFYMEIENAELSLHQIWQEDCGIRGRKQLKCIYSKKLVCVTDN